MAAATIERELTPPEFLQLVGHPLRWQLLRDLAYSDRTVRELTGRAGQPQNLVSYHLAKLRDAGIVSARRSTADRRDAYYRAELARLASMLSTTGETLHPALRGDPARPADADRVVVATGRVLFLCTGNSARSQMAEALMRFRSGGRVESCSAGSKPKPVHPNAARVMRAEYGIDVGDPQSKHLGLFAGQRFDQVITLCDRVREVCPEFPGPAEAVHWSVVDPSVGHPPDDVAASYASFRDTAMELDERIGFLLVALATRHAIASPIDPTTQHAKEHP